MSEVNSRDFIIKYASVVELLSKYYRWSPTGNAVDFWGISFLRGKIAEIRMKPWSSKTPINIALIIVNHSCLLPILPLFMVGDVAVIAYILCHLHSDNVNTVLDNISKMVHHEKDCVKYLERLVREKNALN
jgi:hypothetical protein